MFTDKDIQEAFELTEASNEADFKEGWYSWPNYHDNESESWQLGFWARSDYQRSLYGQKKIKS